MEHERGAAALLDGHVDPEHRHRFQITRVAEGSNVDGTQAGGRNEGRDLLLGTGIVAAIKTVVAAAEQRPG